MGKSDIAVFAFYPFLGEVIGKSQAPVTDILGCVARGITQVSQTTLFHVRVIEYYLPVYLTAAHHGGQKWVRA